MLSAEWLKVRSVRSTAYLVIVAAGCVAFAALWAWYVGHLWDTSPPGRRIREAASGEHLAKTVVPFVMALFGVMTVTSEYATGVIRGSLTAVPPRLRLLSSKAVVVAAVAAATGLAGIFGAFFVGRLVMGDRPIEGYQSNVSDEVPTLLATSAAVVVLALVGLGLGTAFRSTVGATFVVVGLVFVLPAMAQLLPGPWDDRISSVLLPALPEQLANSPDTTGVLQPAAAFVVMLAYVVAALGSGAITLQRRDV